MAFFSRRCFVPSIFVSCIVILGPFGIIATTVDKEGIAQAYQKVWADLSDISWALFAYDGRRIVVAGTGNDYEELISKFTDDVRLYALVQLTTGDETHNNPKLIFITWIGPRVSILQKAGVEMDKQLVQESILDCGREILADEIAEVQYDKVLDIASKIL